ncbi:DUF4160 domain-containing protein [Sedimentibacter sp.]|uniref:DUF4160 domain-containing protein n=1 Tax=Sedimentibacter sp. TaxID=1960295 RepID=UPI0028A14AF1|nr:DUF4160 domain-containing protein [Sedimentibacter sp.]
MPSLFQIGSYRVYFWSNENNEPIHVHVGIGKPTPNATKIWITSSGRCIIANNGSRIPTNELNELLEIISAQFFMICNAWKDHFKVDEIKFYC